MADFNTSVQFVLKGIIRTLCLRYVIRYDFKNRMMILDMVLIYQLIQDHFKVHATTGVKEIRHGTLQKLSGKKSGLYQTERYTENSLSSYCTNVEN